MHGPLKQMRTIQKNKTWDPLLPLPLPQVGLLCGGQLHVLPAVRVQLWGQAIPPRAPHPVQHLQRLCLPAAQREDHPAPVGPHGSYAGGRPMSLTAQVNDVRLDCRVAELVLCCSLQTPSPGPAEAGEHPGQLLYAVLWHHGRHRATPLWTRVR